MALNESILVRLGLDNTAFNRGLMASQQAGGRFASHLKSIFGLTVGVGIFGSLTKRALELGDSLKGLSDSTGLSAETLQTMQVAVQRSGGTMEQADTTLKKFAITLGNARAQGGEAEKTFQDLGVAITDATGKARSNDEVLKDVSDALAKINDPAVLASYSIKLFGRSGVEMGVALSQGSKAVADLRAELEKTGQILSTQTIRDLERFDEILDNVKDKAEKGFSRFLGNWLLNVKVLSQSLGDIDFWKGLTDNEANNRWKERIDATIFGQARLNEKERESLALAKEKAAAMKDQERLLEAMAKAEDKRRNAASAFVDAVLARGKAKRDAVLFSSLEELAGADVSRGATRQLFAQRREAQFQLRGRDRVMQLRDMGLIDQAETLQNTLNFRARNLTLAIDEVRNPLKKFDDQIAALRRIVDISEQQLAELKSAKTYPPEGAE